MTYPIPAVAIGYGTSPANTGDGYSTWPGFIRGTTSPPVQYSGKRASRYLSTYSVSNNLPMAWAICPRFSENGNGGSPSSADGPRLLYGSTDPPTFPPPEPNVVPLVTQVYTYPEQYLPIIGRIPSQTEWVDQAGRPLNEWREFRRNWKPFQGPIILRRVTLGNYYTTAAYRREQEIDPTLTYEQLFTLIGLVPEELQTNYPHFAVWSSICCKKNRAYPLDTLLSTVGSNGQQGVLCGWWLIFRNRNSSSDPLGVDEWSLICFRKIQPDIEDEGSAKLYFQRHFQQTTRGPVMDDDDSIEAFPFPSSTLATKRPARGQPMRFRWDGVSFLGDGLAEFDIAHKPYGEITAVPMNPYGPAQFTAGLNNCSALL